MCLFIIMSISVKRHEPWCTVRDMRLIKCSIIIIIIDQRTNHYLSTQVRHLPFCTHFCNVILIKFHVRSFTFFNIDQQVFYQTQKPARNIKLSLMTKVQTYRTLIKKVCI